MRRPAAAAIAPGLIDSHLHMQWAGLKLLEAFGEAGPPSLAEAFTALDADGLHWNGAAEPTLPERLAALRLIQPVLHAVGMVGVVDPAVVPAEMSAYVASHNRGELTMRVVTMPHPDLTGGADPAIAALDGIGARTGLGDENLRLGGVKVYFDGEGKNSTALRREPWPERADEPDGRGWQRLPDAEFLKLSAWCAREGWSMGVHVVGGAGIDGVLDAWLKVDKETPLAGLGFTLIHAYLEPSPANMELAARLGVLVAAQPSIHWWNGANLEARLGPEARAINPIAVLARRRRRRRRRLRRPLLPDGPPPRHLAGADPRGRRRRRTARARAGARRRGGARPLHDRRRRGQPRRRPPRRARPWPGRRLGGALGRPVYRRPRRRAGDDRDRDRDRRRHRPYRSRQWSPTA